MADEDLIGRAIGGCEIRSVIARGGMGVVYLAEQVTLGRRVAVKVITPELAQDREFRARFQREARLAAAMDHPNVVAVHEAGETDGLLYLVMRYVEGTDLRALITAEGRLAPRTASSIVLQIGDALDAAHKLGLVHRDVKPANILITGFGEDERAYLTDFGLTKDVRAGSELTRTGVWVGTVDYLAPEQIQGQRVDARTDVYSLGCVLYRAVTGEVPFPRDSEMATLWAHVNVEPPFPSRLREDVPAGLDEVIERALAKDPDDRYPSAGSLGRAAVAAQQGHDPGAVNERSVATGAAAPAPASTDVGETRAETPPQRAARTPPPTHDRGRRAPTSRWRARWPIAAAAVGVLGLGLAGVLLAGRSEHRSKPTRPIPNAADTSGSPRPLAPVETELVSLKRAVANNKDCRPLMQLTHSNLRFLVDNSRGPPSPDAICTEYRREASHVTPFDMADSRTVGPVALTDGDAPGEAKNGEKKLYGSRYQIVWVVDGDRRLKDVSSGPGTPQLPPKPAPNNHFAKNAQLFLSALRARSCPALERLLTVPSRLSDHERGHSAVGCEVLLARSNPLNRAVASNPRMKWKALLITQQIGLFGLPYGAGRYAVLVMTAQDPLKRAEVARRHHVGDAVADIVPATRRATTDLRALRQTVAGGA